MIPIEKLKQIHTVVTHANCADGIASAIILNDAISRGNRDSPKIHFMQYGSPELAALSPAPGMIFCDFSPPADRAKEFVDAGAIVLDHHGTARAVVESFGELGVFADEKKEPGVCGASLAYKHVWSQLVAPIDHLVDFVEGFAMLASIRDTWQTSNPLWQNACRQAAVLQFYPWSFWEERTIVGVSKTVDFEALGKVLLQKNDERTAKCIKEAFRFELLSEAAGHEGLLKVLAFEGLSATSDVAEEVGKAADIIVGFGFTVDQMSDSAQIPKMILSLRSHTDFDCAAFAKAHGGGGHTKAAGCSFLLRVKDGSHKSPYPNPYTMIHDLLLDYVSK